MIELIAARGNTSLESAVSLTKSLRWDIQTLGSRVERAVAEAHLLSRGSSKAKSQAQNEMEVKMIIREMRQLLARIEDAVPLINLAITTSGVSLSTTLPATVSPSRLLQASTFLNAGDMQYCSARPRYQQIGPTFILSLYMLFAGHANRAHEEGIRETTWKEVMHKARVKLMRVPPDNVYDLPLPDGLVSQRADEAKHRHIPSDNNLQEFAYQLVVVEDLDDGRIHTFEDDEPQPESYDGVHQAGVREVIPIHEISKIFYADTGKILGIGTEGEASNPILLLKRDVNAAPPRRMMEQQPADTGYDSDDSHRVSGGEPDEECSALEDQLRRESTPALDESDTQDDAAGPIYPWRLPPTLDLEWMALEVYTEDSETDSELSDTEDLSSSSPDLSARVSKLNLGSSTPTSPPSIQNNQITCSPQKSSVQTQSHTSSVPTALPPIKTSLSLLEMLIRLTALQQFQQSSHLAIPDEFLNFFLSDSSTVGAGGDSDLRKRVRREARQRVGFDPYDESPIKRRGEERIEHELNEARSPGFDDDYDTYPTGRVNSRASSRAGTPIRSMESLGFEASSTPYTYSAGRSTDISLGQRPSLSSLASPSPLLRRATTQPDRGLDLRKENGMLGRPPAAPRTSSSSRQGRELSGLQSMRGSVAPDTPPSSTRKQV